MIITMLNEALDADDLLRRTGWEIKLEGACRGSVCVPLPDGAALTPRLLHERLGMPLVGDEQLGVWALGPSTASGRALDTAKVPDIELPDVDGKPFKLSSLLGRKVVVVAWASW
jgi:hypothetical protein